jgi:Cu/Ag efflux pump CusA
MPPSQRDGCARPSRRWRPRVALEATVAKRTNAGDGLVPPLFATGPGSEIQRSLATVVIGGLVSATLLTLILLPILYRHFGAKRI